MKKILAFIVMLIFAQSIAMAETVMYNTKTGKFHKLSCRWAKQCSVNCIKIEKQQAKARGGVACKVCGS